MIAAGALVGWAAARYKDSGSSEAEIVYSNPEMSLKSKGWSSLSGPLLKLLMKLFKQFVSC